MRTTHKNFRRVPRRKGTVLVLSCFCMIFMVGILAYAIDIPAIQAAKSEMQRSADSAAMAAAWELYREKLGINTEDQSVAAIYASANAYAGLNTVNHAPPSLANDSTDVSIGYVDWMNNPDASLDKSDFDKFNTVEVHVRRTAANNGELPLFFASIFGKQSAPVEVHSRAGFANMVNGFELTSDDSTLNIMPFAIDEETWNDVVNGIGSDNYSYNEQNETVFSGSDGIVEFSLYPLSTGSQANRGTVDIGSSSNSTARVSRQITDGVSKQDLIDLGKPLELDENGEIELGADPGMSNGFKDELESIIGEDRVIMVFSEMSGNGNNGVYTIVKFVGVKVLDVKLTGNPNGRHLTLQPSAVVARHTTVSTSEDLDTSDYVYSPVILVQ